MTKRTVDVREVAEGLDVIAGCIEPDFITEVLEEVEGTPDWHEEGEEIHSQFNAYLVSGEERLLFDTLPPNMREEALEAVETLLDGDSLDYLVISHPEAPHGGNADALLERYPDAEVLVPGVGSLHELHLDAQDLDPRAVDPGETVDLGGRVVEFVEPLFYDLATTIWMVDRGTDALFTVDAYGNPHSSSECGAFVEEIAPDPDTHAVLRWLAFHSHTVPWMAYVEPERIEAELEALVDCHDPEMLAPAHGAPVREDAATYLRAILPIVEGITDVGLGQDVRAVEMI